MTIRGKLTYNVFEVINLKFSKTELWLIIYALEHEITELDKKLESSNKDYKNEKGEIKEIIMRETPVIKIFLNCFLFKFES